MKPVVIDDIKRYTFYGNLKPCGNALVMAAGKASADENAYDYQLLTYKDGSIKPLTTFGKESSFFVKDDNTVLFAGNRHKKEGHTFIYEMSLDGGEAQVLADLDQDNAAVAGLYENQLVLLIQKELHKEEADYEVFDEVPFYFNGQGIINKKRTGLYVYDLTAKELKQLTADNVDVAAVEIHENKIYYTGADVKPVRPTFDTLSVYDLLTGENSQLLAPEHIAIYGMKYCDGQLLIMGSDMKAYGLNENPCLYAFDADGLKKVSDLDLAFGNTVGTDCRLVGGNAMYVFEDKLYFMATVGAEVHLFVLEDSHVHEYFAWQGSIDAFCLTKDGLFFIGAAPAKLQQLYQWQQGDARQLSDFNPLFADTYVALPQAISYEGTEGCMLEGWVLYPKDFDPAKTYPGILDIHGGPKTVYGTIYYHEMQVWASQGYFVFFTNIHGSDGFGNEFADIRGKYGTKDFDDLMLFTDAVLKAVPQLDPARLGVTGGSYGGFMTNWIVTHTNRFKAAATQRSISNWTSFAGTSDIGIDFVQDQQQGYLDNIDILWRQSPIASIKNAVTPTLIIHSDEDYRCPIEQGMQMLTGLLNNGTEARMVVFHGENHDLSRSGKPEHRIRRLKEITEWMNGHLGNSQ